MGEHRVVREVCDWVVDTDELGVEEVVARGLAIVAEPEARKATAD